MKLKKINLTQLPLLVKLICFILLLIQPGITSLASNVSYSINRIEPVKDEPIKKASIISTRNNKAVKIHPDIIKREMHVVAKENEGKVINFFVFDLQGTLLRNFNMKFKDHEKITGLEKGIYIYRVFCGDEETVSGKFEIR